MGALVMSAGLLIGNLFGGGVAATVAPPRVAAAPPVLEVRVYDPALQQMARELEREVFPLLPAGAAIVRR